MALPSFILSLVSLSTSNTQPRMTREFRFVPYGQSFSTSNDKDTARPTISCDGRIEGGVTLELTHWRNNQTPDNLYADTSTEMAINLAETANPSYDSKFDDALILNNHYDTDGVLSVWACLEPQKALAYRDLLSQGAAAGDFGEWSSDNGVKLDCIVESFLESSEEEAYRNVLNELPDVLKDLEATGGASYQSRWKGVFESALQDWEILSSEHVQRGPGRLVVVAEQSPPLSPFALDRRLREFGLWKGTTRVLCSTRTKDGLYQYRYRMPGHGWVKKLVQRHSIPSVDASTLVQWLTPKGSWKPSGGLTGICQSTRAITTEPSEVASMLHELDPGCQ